MSKLFKKAYKYRFYPQNDLKVLLAKTFGCVRFVYNQTLEFSEKHYADKLILESQGLLYKNITGSDRINFVKSLKDSIEDNLEKDNFGKLKYPWLHEVSSIALQQSARHLNDAYSRFFKGQSAKPTFKSKHLNHNSFTITGKNSIHFDKDFTKNKYFYLPKYDKPLNIKWGKSKSTQRKFNRLAVSSVTISQNPSGQYFISFLVEQKIVSQQANNDKVSVDLGLKTTAKVYEGKVNTEGKAMFTDLNLPDLLKDIDKKLRKTQRELIRKVKGSKNRDKKRLKVARLHQKRVNIITDYYQKKSTIMIKENQEIVLEDLNISGMKRNRKISRAIHHVAWAKFIAMILYKARWHNRTITRVDRYYPSSKTCSSCGYINHGLKLSDREWMCYKCETNHDRDENACLNLYSYKKTTVGTTVNACRGNIRPNASKKIFSKKKMAVSNEAGISLI